MSRLSKDFRSVAAASPSVVAEQNVLAATQSRSSKTARRMAIVQSAPRFDAVEECEDREQINVGGLT
jgi:hypothetical protein